LSRLIKCAALSASEGPCKISVRPATVDNELRGAQTEVEQMIDRARQQADIIIRSARAEAQTVLDEARKEGLRAGMTEAIGRCDELIQRIEDDIASLQAEREEFIERLEPEVLKLCLSIAEKIIRHEVKTDHRVVLRAIKACLRRVKNNGEVFVRVSPEEIEGVRAKRDELVGILDGVATVSVVDDRRVSPGGCVVETATGDLDARIETQLERIEKRLQDTYEDGCREAGTGPDEISEDNTQDRHRTG